MSRTPAPSRSAEPTAASTKPSDADAHRGVPRTGPSRTGAVVVAGALARRIEYGGHLWALLQWVLGFRRLGWSVLVLDRLEPAPGLRGSERVKRFTEVMEGFGLRDAYSLDLGPDEEPVGRPRQEVRQRVAEADLLLNIMGYLEDEVLLGLARRRVFLDIDPGFGQMWKSLGLCDLFQGHDDFVTVGTKLGADECRVPACGLPWIPTLPPVVLGFWPPTSAEGRRFTSVGSWRGPYDPVEFEGETYGLRVHEFRRFTRVPRASGLPFEVALEIDPADAPDARRLREGGWRLADPRVVAGNPWAYRQYVRESRGEFSVAKGIYVRSRSGWVSDRTVCYLASGRPAVVQETGLDGVLPTGEGLVTFETPEEAVTRVRDVDARWDRHARAARELAAEYFDSDRVLERLGARLAA